MRTALCEELDIEYPFFAFNPVGQVVGEIDVENP
jgi:hypothetical protein